MSAGGGAEGEEPGVDPALEEALRALDAPPARAGFAERLRADFVAGFAGRENASREPDPERTARVSRADGPDGPAAPSPVEPSFPRVPIAEPAREAFRRELRAAFVSGELAEGAEGEATPARPRLLADAEPGTGGSRIPRLLALAGGLAAAALLLVLFRPGLLGGGSDPVGPLVPGSWVARDLGQPGQVLVAGRPYDANDLVAVARALNRREVLETRTCPVELVLDGRLRLRVAPDSLLRPREPGEGEGALAALPFELVRGEIWIQTWGRAPSALEVETPEARVRITGTVLSIAAHELGTCVCVESGKVVVEPKRPDQAPRPVASRTTCFVFADPDQGLYQGSFEETAVAMPEVQASHYPQLLAFSSEEL